MGEIHKKKGFIVIFALSLFGYKKIVFGFVFAYVTGAY